jgi:hypothetical protein
VQVMDVRTEDEGKQFSKEGFTLFLDRAGRLRLPSEGARRPYQLLVGMAILCAHCHSIKNLEKVRNLAARGKFDIEPILQHYMKVNDVTRESALRQWAASQGEARHYDTHPFDEEAGRMVAWAQFVLGFDQSGNKIENFIAIEDWIKSVVEKGPDEISSHLFNNNAEIWSE